MFDSLDFTEVDEREGSKRKKSENLSKYSEEEGGSTVATFPMFKRKKGRDLWLLHEDSGYAQFSGERLFEGHSCVNDSQQQAENGIKSRVSFPENEHVKKLQLRRKKKMKKVIEEDKVVNSCRDNFNSDSPWIHSVRTCMQACLQEVTESRNQILKWMREEIQNFLYRETLTSGLQMAFSGHGNAYGSPEVAAANLTFESEGGRNTGLSFEGQDYAFREHNFGTKPESVKFGDTFPGVAGMRFGRKNDVAELKGVSFGGQCADGRGTHMEVQPSGSLGEMRFTAQRSQVCALNTGHAKEIAGIGLAGPSIGTGGSFSVPDVTQGSNYAVTESLPAGNLKSAHAHTVENSFGLHLQNNLNVAKVHGATSGVQNPIALGMMWNVMHHNMVGLSPGVSNHGIVNYSSGMANKTGNDIILRSNMVYENHIPFLNSSLHNGANVSLGMQLPLALQTSSPAGTVQSFVSIPTAVGMQSPVGMPSFINLGMAGSTGHMGSAFNGQFIQTPTISECNTLEKSTTGREPMIPASAKKNSQNLPKIRFSKSRV